MNRAVVVSLGTLRRNTEARRSLLTPAAPSHETGFQQASFGPTFQVESL